jgi:Fe-S-cluster containining protein
MEIEHQAKRARMGKPTRWNGEDLIKLSDMLILIGTFFIGTPHEATRGNSLKNHKTKYVGYKENRGRAWHYTCKHFDEKSGNCMNYENRPKMCSSYPNGGACQYKNCTSSCASKKVQNEATVSP